MPSRILTNDHLEAFAEWLNLEEKSSATCEKYIRDIRRFMKFTADEAVSKEVVAHWKNDLIAQGYAVRSINSMLASLNSLLVFLEWGDCKVKIYASSIRPSVRRRRNCPERSISGCFRPVREMSRQICFCRPSAQQASGFRNCGISRLMR